MVHVWRLIGWHLGILDEFNTCTSLEVLEQCVEDYMVWTPRRFLTCREATHELQLSVVRGFGTYIILGERYFEALMKAGESSRFAGLSYVRFRPLPGLVPIV